jgi:ribose transport system ATP-binding protein
MSATPVFETSNLTRRFGAVTALTDANLTVLPGEVHGLVGENGAGKTTLIRIAAGLVQRHAGEMRLDGHPYDPSSPLDATRQGVRVVSQEFDLAPNLSVAENLCLSSETFLASRRAGWYLQSRAVSSAAVWLDAAGVSIDPRTPVSQLPVSSRQLIALVRGVLDEQRIVFLDEPSSALDQEGMTILERLVHHLREDNVAVVYVSHKMEEIFDLCDRITVMRDGRTVAVRDRADTTVNEIVNLMVGREIDRMFPPRPDAPPGPPVLEATSLTAPGVHDVDLTVRRGEILGIGGLVGSGRTELAKAICGLSPLESGEIRMEGRIVEIRARADALRLKMEYVTEDRHGEGLVFTRPIAENVSSRVLRSFTRGPLVSGAAERRFARQQMTDFKIAAASEMVPVQLLSGGNQQKTLLAACVASDPHVIFFDEPTRGIDVGAKAQIYELIRQLSRDRAVAVISAELIELLGLADRIIMMRAGRVVGEFDARSATEEALVSVALGVSDSGATPA